MFFIYYLFSKLLHSTLIFLKNRTISFYYCSLSIAAFEIMISSWFNYTAILLSNDVETNPGPRQNTCQTLSISHWNLNSISSYNFEKLSSFIAFNCVHNFDIICFSETYLNSETLSEDENLKIPGYTFVRKDHPDRKSTRLNSSHANISYAVFCLKKKKKTHTTN